MKLVNKMSEYQPLIDLDIFTDKTKLRMNDRSLIEELAAYLFKGISDKRTAVEDLFNTEITATDADVKYRIFCTVIDRINHISSSIKPINETRYKQRNDFYTLFCFVDSHRADSTTLLEKQYKVLVYISDNGLITPSNDEYELFKEYAINCVSQSNSKKARERRLLFFNNLLAHTLNQPSEEQLQLIDFAENELDKELSLFKEKNYLLIGIDE